jgi:hypothetical protein
MSTAKTQHLEELGLNNNVPPCDTPQGEKELGIPSYTHDEILMGQEEPAAILAQQNKRAIKGDDSDGKVDWTVKSLLAALSLCMLYTGECR